MRPIDEDPRVISAIADATGASEDTVTDVVRALRETIDYLVLDGYSIIALPFTLVYEDDPVIDLLTEKIDTATEEQLEALQTGDDPEIARFLGISEDEYLEHPVAGEATVLVHLLGRRPAATDEETKRTVRIVEAWFDTFADRRRYRFSSVGYERDLEDWLIEHPEVLEQLGYTVRLRHRQLVLPDLRRPDLVFDLIEPNGTVGTLVVELKAVHGTEDAVGQLVGYLDALEDLGVDGPLLGLLIADGFSPTQLAHAKAHGINVATLSSLGYRGPALGESPQSEDPVWAVDVDTFDGSVIHDAVHGGRVPPAVSPQGGRWHPAGKKYARHRQAFWTALETAGTQEDHARLSHRVETDQDLTESDREDLRRALETAETRDPAPAAGTSLFGLTNAEGDLLLVLRADTAKSPITHVAAPPGQRDPLQVLGRLTTGVRFEMGSPATIAMIFGQTWVAYQDLNCTRLPETAYAEYEKLLVPVPEPVDRRRRPVDPAARARAMQLRSQRGGARPPSSGGRSTPPRW